MTVVDTIQMPPPGPIDDQAGGAIPASPPLSPPRGQARGRARRQALLQAGRTLLSERDMDEISLTAVAEQAGIPASSTYHFYSDMKELYKDLARTIAAEIIGTPPTLSDALAWPEIVRAYLRVAFDFFNNDQAARQLMLGPKTAPDIKRAGCGQATGFGDALEKLLRSRFILPHLPDSAGLFYRAIQLSDVMFSLSIAEHGVISEFYFEESCRAALAYLGLYIPQFLCPRSETSGDGALPRPFSG